MNKLWFPTPYDTSFWYSLKGIEIRDEMGLKRITLVCGYIVASEVVEDE